METILKLLRSKSNEEKIAGVFLSVKYFNLTGNDEAVHLTNKNAVNLMLIVKATEPIFLIRMLKHAKLNSASMSILRSIESFPTVLSLFAPYLADIYDTIPLEQSNLASDSRPAAAASVLRFLSAVCIARPPPPATARALLLRACNTLSRLTLLHTDASLPVVAWLGGLAEQLPAGRGSSTPLLLEKEAAASLRGALLHGWQGSTLEAVRDTYLRAAARLLLVLQPEWTLELAGPQPGAERAAGAPQQLGHFASLVCAVSCGEFRILCDEFVSILESHVPLAGQEGAASVLPASHSAQLGVRHQRIGKMHVVCFDLFDVMLDLLVGEDGRREDEDEDEDKEDEGGAWAALPASCLMSFRNEMSSSINLYFEVVKEASRCLRETRALEDRRLAERAEAALRHALAPFLSRGLRCFSRWMAEDDTLYTPFLDHVSEALSFSRVPLPLCTLTAWTGPSLTSRPVLSPDYVLQVAGVLLGAEDEELDVFVACLPLLLEVTDQQGLPDAPSSSSSKKLVFSSSTNLLPLLLSTTLSLLSHVEQVPAGGIPSLAQCSHQQDRADSEPLDTFEVLIERNRALTLCCMCVQLFSNIMLMKVDELYGSSKSISKMKQSKKGAGSLNLSDDGSFSDEMVAEYLGISASLADMLLLMDGLVRCMRSSASEAIAPADSDDSDCEEDPASAAAGGGGDSCDGGLLPRPAADFEREVASNKVVLAQACGELLGHLREAFSPEFFRHVVM